MMTCVSSKRYISLCAWMTAFALLIGMFLLTGCNSEAPDDTSDTTSTTVPTEPAEPLPTVDGIAEGSLTDAQAALFASGNHQSMKWTVLPDATATKEATVLEDDGSFFDDFAGGVDSSIWHIVKQKWGGGNNGVIRENVGYTEDGVLVLTAHGDYYEGDANKGRGKRSGACLATKQVLGPGSYEVRMKVLPRMGTCTAMWTYFNDGPRNHEIDIELPGNTKSFHYSLFTNWLTEQKNTSQHRTPSFYHNDGEWHTYRFDWHTDDPHIDYYIDGELQLTATTNIPTVAGHFWVGVWFPQNWCGDPAFETAYMLVDWVKYTPYDEEHEVANSPFNGTPTSAYELDPITLPVNNYAADGRFDYGTEAVWETTGNAARVHNPATDSLMLRVDDERSSAAQVVSSINSEAEYTITAAAMAAKAGSKAKLTIECLGVSKTTPLNNGVFEMTFDQNTMTVQSQNFTMPVGTYYLRLRLGGEGEGEFYFDDLFVTQQTRGDFVLS